MQLQNAIETYLNWKTSYTTKAAIPYRTHLYRFFDYISKQTVEAVVLEDITRFQLWLKKKYAMANVAYAMIILKNFFEFQKRQGTICLDPYFIRIPKFVPNSHKALSLEEFIVMDKMLGDEEFWEIEKKLVHNLLWETGVRVSELCDLNISDLDSNRMSAQVKTKKNNKLRWIFWTPKTHALLLRYLGIRICLNQYPALFIASHGSVRDRVTCRTIQRWVKEIGERAKLQRIISPHCYRHGKAHQMLSINPGCVKDIQQILGHSEDNPRASFSYLRLSSDEMEVRARMYLTN